MDDVAKADVFRPWHKLRPDQVAIRVKAKPQSRGVRFATNKTGASMGKLLHRLGIYDVGILITSQKKCAWA